MTLLATTYCTESDVKRRLSADGVVAFADHDQDGVADDGVVDDAINWATLVIDQYCRGRYDAASLAASDMVRYWAVDLAAVRLCQMRGNPVPDSLIDAYQELLGDGGMLGQIKSGSMSIAGVAQSHDLRPGWSNLLVDRRWPHSKSRVTKANSSDAPSELTQDTAYEPVTVEYDY